MDKIDAKQSSQTQPSNPDTQYVCSLSCCGDELIKFITIFNNFITTTAVFDICGSQSEMLRYLINLLCLDKYEKDVSIF